MNTNPASTFRMTNRLSRATSRSGARSSRPVGATLSREVTSGCTSLWGPIPGNPCHHSWEPTLRGSKERGKVVENGLLAEPFACPGSNASFQPTICLEKDGRSRQRLLICQSRLPIPIKRNTMLQETHFTLSVQAVRIHNSRLWSRLTGPTVASEWRTGKISNKTSSTIIAVVG